MGGIDCQDGEVGIDRVMKARRSLSVRDGNSSRSPPQSYDYRSVAYAVISTLRAKNRRQVELGTLSPSSLFSVGRRAVG
jgi:hypothetical protein